jgi:molecular chaperone HtpG
MQLFKDNGEKSLQLYVNRVFIQDDAKELLPDYLKFLKGVVETEDLPLNVSREFTQASPVVSKIKTILTGKILA